MESTYFLNIGEVARFLRCSVVTIRRRLAERRQGRNNFPLPVTKSGQAARWRVSDIEEWDENNTPDAPRPETSVQRKRRLTVAKNGLARLGLKTQ